MNYTSHYNLHKPELSEQFDLADWNTNSDLTDAQMFQNANDISTIMSALTTKDVSSSDTLYYKLMKLVYPVGSIYWSGNNTNPATLFGGTWTRIKDKFLWAMGDSDTLDATGGAKTVTLTTANMPKHSHSFSWSGSHTHRLLSYTGLTRTAIANTYPPNSDSSYIGESSRMGVCYTSTQNAFDQSSITDRSTSDLSSGYAMYANWGGKQSENYKRTIIENTTISISTNTGTSGSDTPTAVNKMPPYICKYCWQRTAL